MIGVGVYECGSKTRGIQTTSFSGFIGRRRAFGAVLGTFGGFYKKDVHDRVFKEGTIIGYITSLSACSTLNTIQGLNPSRFLDQQLHGRICSEISVSRGQQLTPCYPQ